MVTLPGGATVTVLELDTDREVIFTSGQASYEVIRESQALNPTTQLTVLGSKAAHRQ